MEGLRKKRMQGSGCVRQWLLNSKESVENILETYKLYNPNPMLKKKKHPK